MSVKVRLFCPHNPERLHLHCFSVSILSCVLARVQFSSLWTAARHRSDHAVPPAHLVTPGPVMRGITWLLPSHSLPSLIPCISAWSQHYPRHVTSPIYIQTLHDTYRDPHHPNLNQQGPRSRTSSVGSSSSHLRSSHGARGTPGQGYLSPRLEGCSSPLATLWYDWFLPETNPDHSQVGQLEKLFQQAGGVKCWTGDRLVSPLGEEISLFCYD